MLKRHTKARTFVSRTKDRRDTHVHIRGVYTRHGEKVNPDTPAILPALDVRGDAPDRLDLAQWLFREDNSLTARVAVNRIWQHLFGQGLVSTPNDFGSQGAKPIHPQLLDWLATELLENGWNRKQFLKTIVTSATYRQNALTTRDKMALDPDNRWLTRAHRARLSAETVRDQALFASGVLSRKMFGHPGKPPQPKS